MTDEKRDFDALAGAWDDNAVRVKLIGDIADAMRQALVLSADMDVLDCGCGTGLLGLSFAPRVKSLTGVDSSLKMLEMFNAKARRENLQNVCSRQVDLDKGEAPPGQFHLVISSMALHHIRNTDALLSCLHRVLLPGGVLCLADLDSEDGQFHGDTPGVFHLGFDRKAMKDAFARAGFVDVQVSTAAEITKPIADGGLKTFSVFLAKGTRAG